MGRVLVVEDEADIAMALQVLLAQNGHEVHRAGDGALALRAVHALQPDLVLLDVGLPVLDGWAVLTRLRDVSEVPVLLLTASGRDEDKVRGLRAGADDYLTKPFSNAELVARVEALLRRSGSVHWDAPDLFYGPVQVSATSHTVTVAGKPISVTPQEFRLLTTFVRNQGQVLATAQLLSLVWGDHSGQGGERVKFAVLRLRRKLGWADASTSPLVAVRGIGYRLEADQSERTPHS